LKPFLPKVTTPAPRLSPTIYSTLRSAMATTRGAWRSHAMPKCRRASTAGT
jgi:hypothetical protein